MSVINLSVEFKGGLELLFNNENKKRLTLPVESDVVNLKALIHYLKNNHLTERAELFVENDSVRPGILVLVNDVDWEILGGENYQLKDEDNVLFISTLHGG